MGKQPLCEALESVLLFTDPSSAVQHRRQLQPAIHVTLHAVLSQRSKVKDVAHHALNIPRPENVLNIGPNAGLKITEN